MAPCLMVLALAGCGDDGGPERDESGALVEPGPVDPFDLQPGDCFDDPPELRAEDPAETLEVVAVDCDAPHDREVFALVEVPGEDDEYPGAATIQEQAQERCEARLPDYVGSDPEPLVEVSPYLFPSAESWERGDREVVCVLYGGETEQLVGSMRDDPDS